jgi:hypothetical protein
LPILFIVAYFSIFTMVHGLGHHALKATKHKGKGPFDVVFH